MVAGVPAGEVDAALAGVEEELLFHMVTNPALRETIAYGSTAEGSGEGLESITPVGLSTVPGLSDTLRGRLDG